MKGFCDESDDTRSMDLKQVQEELRKDILNHQTLMEQLKQRPTDHALNMKLKDIQKHIADLGSKQKKILETRTSVQSGTYRGNLKGLDTLQLQTTSFSGVFTTPQLQAKDMKSNQSSRSSDSSSSYALIAIKSQKSSTNLTHLVSASPTNSIAMNLTNQAVSKSGTAFVSSPTLLVVSSPNQISSTKHHIVGSSQAPKPTSIPVSLASLASNGGVVTLAGAWQSTQNQLPTQNAKEMGRVVQKQVQIKLPVVQSHGSKPVILMPQKNQTVNSKSLFRLLPKGQHGLTVTGPTSIATGISAQAVIPSTAIKSSNAPQKQLSAILMTADGCKNPQTLQRLVVQHSDQRPVSKNQASSTWKDLSSQTPSIRKPSYIPRKSFPNINNGVGSFKKFRILDGKTETLNDKPTLNQLQCISSATQDKPKNSALKAVLTSSSVPTSGMMTVARLVPLPVSRNGFFPIQQHTATLTPKAPIKPVATIPNIVSAVHVNPVPSVCPIGTTNNTSSRRYVSNSKSPDLDDQAKEKVRFLRNIELIPKEQAEKVRGRRFRKRRVAANPVYSGGMYVTNEIEPKRQCPDLLASAAESITAPDVIVKRPRGRPRGSKNATTLAMKLQSSARSNRSHSPADQTSVQYVQRLKSILDSVASVKSASNLKPPIKPEPMDQSLAQSEIKAISGNTHASSTSVKLKSGSTSSERSESPEGSDEHEDQCAICGRTGEVLMCDTCSRVYHLSCATPPLDMVPQGMWVCSECKKAFKESKSKIEWPGIAAAVHAFSDFDKLRDKEIEVCQNKQTESKRIVTSQQVQMKALTAVVTTKVNHRMNAAKERQSTQKTVNEMTSVLRRCFTLATTLSEKTASQQSGRN